MESKQASILLAGQFDPQDLLATFGAPLYVYDAAIIRRQYERLREVFGQTPSLKINYACKALSNVSIMQLLRQMGSGVDTVSIQEVELALLAGFAPEDIVFTPNGVSFEEIALAIAKGVRLNLDNIPMLERLGKYHPAVAVTIRINPGIMAGGNSKISVGHEGAKFGIGVSHLPEVLEVVKIYGLRVEGVHMHTGSDILDASAFLQGLEVLLGVAEQFPDLAFIDIGSGFKVPYKAGGPATDMEELGAKVSQRFNQFCQQYGRPLSLVIEPGKFLVSEAGTFLVKVNVVKQTTSKTFVGVDSGLNHLIRPMFYDAYHEIHNLSNPAAELKTYDIVGYICETDTFASERQVPEVREGDILAIRNAGAYCMSMASNYNSRPRPAEVLLLDGEAHLIRRRETMADILSTQVFTSE